jgi:hypothetical protein
MTQSSMRIPEVAAVVLLAISACSGCAMPTPQQNLDDQLKGMIGESLEPPPHHLRPELLLRQKDLGNGIIQRRYRYLGDCVLVVEANAKTSNITNAWAEGSAKSCILPP